MTRLLVLAVLMVVCAASQQLSCDVSNLGELTLCLRYLLEESRDKIRPEVDPLYLKNSDEYGIHNIRVHGLSEYSVEYLDVSFLGDQRIVLSARIAWPFVNADADLKVRKCKRIVFKFCAKVRARPHITVDRSVGSLTATLTIGIDIHGKPTVTPSNINVDLSLPKIRVKAHVCRVRGFFHMLFGDPASQIVTREANKWWGENRGQVEHKAKEALATAIREDVAPRLTGHLKH